MIANAWLRPGNTADSSSCKEFMKETFEQILANKKVGLVRADSGFYTQEILNYLESQDHNYIITTSWCSNNNLKNVYSWNAPKQA